MLLSIIIPVYNGERVIKRCLDSIFLNNANNDFEVLVVNDGSKDNTKNILEQLKKDEARIKVFNNENKGVSYARNYALEKASGKFVMFIDADDYLSEMWFDTVKEELNTENDIIYYCNNIDITKVTKESIIEEITGLKRTSVAFPTPWSKLFKREFIGETRYEEKIINGEDLLFNLEMILKTDNYKIVKKSIYNYMIYQGSTTSSFNKRIIESDKIFQEKLSEILNKSSLNEELIKKIKEYSLERAILLLNNRISHISKYKDAKIEFEKINQEPYNKILRKINLKISAKKDVILLLNKYRLYFFAYIILKSSNKKRFKKGIKEVCIQV